MKNLLLVIVVLVATLVATAAPLKIDSIKVVYTPSLQQVWPDTFHLGRQYSVGQLYSAILPDNTHNLVWNIMYDDTSNAAVRPGKFMMSSSRAGVRTFSILDDKNTAIPFIITNAAFNVAGKDTMTSVSFDGVVSVITTQRLQCNRVYRLVVNQPYKSYWYPTSELRFNKTTRKYEQKFMLTPIHVPFVVE